MMMLVALVTMVTVFWSPVSTNLYDPHTWPNNGPYFEGWYWRLIDFEQEISLGILYGHVQPQDPSTASKLQFIGVILSGNDSHNMRLEDYNYFPDYDHEMIYTVKGGEPVTTKPSISLPAFSEMNIINKGNLTIKQNGSTAVFNNIGNVNIKIDIGEAVPWSVDYSGPEGTLIQQLPLPLHWFVFSLMTPVKSYHITNSETGETIEGSSGVVHMEKNWGHSFPPSWIWIQGAALSPEKVAFAATYGTLEILVVSMNASLAGYRNYDRDINIDFRPDNTHVAADMQACADPTWLHLTFNTISYKVTVNISAPKSTFGECLYGPLQQGFRRVCAESFRAVAVIDVYKRDWFLRLNHIDHQEIKQAALEFGGNWACSRTCHQSGNQSERPINNNAHEL